MKESLGIICQEENGRINYTDLGEFEAETLGDMICLAFTSMEEVGKTPLLALTESQAKRLGYQLVLRYMPCI